MSGETSPPPRFGTRRNPQTGDIETYELPPLADVVKARRELHEMLHGGQWFDDPLSRPAEP
jgi:hypothetical protein